MLWLIELETRLELSSMHNYRMDCNCPSYYDDDLRMFLQTHI